MKFTHKSVPKSSTSVWFVYSIYYIYGRIWKIFRCRRFYKYCKQFTNMRKKFDTYWLYFKHKNLDSIFSAFNLVNLPSDFEIKLFTLISGNDLFKEIKEWVPENFKVNYLEENENLVTLKIIRTFNSGKVIEGNLNLVKIGNSDTYVAISYDSSKFVKEVMIPFFNHFYSNTSKLNISSEQIKKILDNLKDKIGGEITTDRVISYSRIKNKSIDLKGGVNDEEENFHKRTRESDVRWTYEDYTSSFEKAAENDQWIDKITFSVKKNKEELFSGFLSREGLFKCNRNLKLFFDIIFDTVLKIGNDKIRAFKQRSRGDNKGNIKPICIEYSGNVFKDTEQNHRLIKAISEFPKSTYTLYHGNPYVHVSLVDYFDGSSYDLWVLSEDKITIVPQLKSSFSSISRLCEHIFKKFKEGEIKELVINQDDK